MAIARYEFQQSKRPSLEINDAALMPVQVANIQYLSMMTQVASFPTLVNTG